MMGAALRWAGMLLLCLLVMLAALVLRAAFTPSRQRAVPATAVVAPAFDLQAELLHVRQICRLVEGAPMAIELAAAWLKALPCAQVAREIRKLGRKHQDL